MKKNFAAPLLAIVSLLLSILGWQAFADAVPRGGRPEELPPVAAAGEPLPEIFGGGIAENARLAEGVPRVRRIGAAATPGAGAIQLVLDSSPEAISHAFLVYELAGVPHWTATVRSINGLPAQGGFGAVPSSGTALQMEEINPRWLRQGVNQILFLPAPLSEPAPSRLTGLNQRDASAPAEPEGSVPYTVRNLRLVYLDGAARPAPRLRLSHPLHGENGAEGSILRGFVEPAGLPTGPAELFVNGVHIPQGVDPVDGAFAVFVPRTAPEGEPWEAEIEVVYPDGSRLRRTVRLTGETRSDDGESEGDTAELDADPGSAKSLALGKARLDVTPGALAGKVKLTMRGLRSEQLPALDAGMTNVTPGQGGFRMGPHGLRFKKPIELSLPYDAALIPQGMTLEDVRTFFFDEEAGRWIPLPRVDAKAGGDVIVSLTDHFTDFINATLALPDEPSGASFSPNSLQELAKADPASGIVQIEPPDGGPTGDAMLDFPIVVPPGRRGLEPELAVHYNSSGGNGWLGVGWDLRLPSIEVSTLFGVPRYDGTERYFINGEQLAPTSDPEVFVRRAEGSFEQIVRKGSGPANYWWEVTDKDGTRSLYGQTPQARLRDPSAPHNTFRWYLERVVDLHGNTIDYSYATDSGGGGGEGEPWVEVYPARIDYTGVQGAGAFYHVRFNLDDGQQRPDHISSGRQGFKTFLTRRLTSVDVLAGGSLVRRYLFSYREGDFRKSLLESIAVTGEDGATELYRHTFDYERMATVGDDYDGFEAERTWGTLGAFDAATDALGGSGGAHIFAGLGPPGCQPHVGVQAGFSVGGRDTQVTFLDVNGDGLPDRVSNGKVDLNRYLPDADQGGFESGRFDGASGFENTLEWSFDFGGGGHALGELANLGASWVWSHSNDTSAIADLNGDGLPDIARARPKINTGSSFEELSDWSSGGPGGLGLSNPEEEEEVLTAFKASDALRRLRLPYSGKVVVAGAVQRKQQGGDGVEVAIYQNRERRWRHSIPSSDTSSCVPGAGNACDSGLTLDVTAGDDLYFLASSGRDTEADALLWAPRVTYAAVLGHPAISPQDLLRREPYGARVFAFDAAEDFRLAGYFGTGWDAPATGVVRLLGPIAKQTTSDDVRVEILRWKEDDEEHEHPILVHSRVLPALTEATIDAAEFPSIEVERGDSLELRISSETPIDPDRVAWTPAVTYEGGTYCRPYRKDDGSIADDACGTVSCGAETCSLSNDPTPSSATHPEEITQPARVRYGVPKLLPGDQPTVSWEGGDGGPILVSWNPVFPSPATLVVQGIHRLLAKVSVNGPALIELDPKAPAGEPLFFTLLSSSAVQGSLVVGGQAVPYNVRHPALLPQKEALPGGYHGWFYGEWDGGKTFDEAALTPPEDEEDSKDYVVPVPRWQGGKLLSAPMWQAAGFDLYIAAEGVKPSRRGGNAAAQLDAANGGSAAGLSLVRKSSGRTAGVSASLAAGVSLSTGSTDTDLDLLDMNGDGYADQVSKGRVRFSDGSSGFGEPASFPGLSGSLRKVKDANFAKSIGVGITFSRKDGQGNSKAVLSTMPSVGTVTAMSQKRTDLMDVNGDGLPDRVTRSSQDVLDVQLNLGYRFGETERWPLPRWDSLGSRPCSEPVSPLDTQIASGVAGIDVPASLELTVSAGLQVGAAFGPVGAGASSTLSRTIVGLADVNGDGLPDHVAKDHGDGFFRVRLNLGDGWDAERLWRVPSWQSEPDGVYNPAGKTFQCLDALHLAGNLAGDVSVGAPICIPLVPPVVVAGLQIEPSVQASAGPGGTQITFEDLDGDGLPDHVLRTRSAVFVKRNKAARANLLTTVQRPLGSTLQLAYRRQGNRVGRSDDGQRRVDMPGNQWVLAGTIVHDGRGNAYTTTFNYFNEAFYDRAEREGYGYARVLTTLPDGSTIDRAFHNQDLYRRHLLREEKIADASGNLFQAETFDYELRALGARAAFPALVREETLFYEGTGAARKTTGRTFQYDAAGNVIALRDFADEGLEDDVAAMVAYHTDPQTHVVRPASIDVRDGAGRLLRQRQGTYDGFGDLVRLEQTLIGGRDPETGSTYAGAKNAVWTFGYDERGNLTSSADPTGFTSTFHYDPAVQTYPVEVRDSFGYVTRYRYNLNYGVLTEATDQNGNSIRRAYDGFGRLVRVVGPYDSDATPALAFEYGPGAPISWAVVHHKDATRSDLIDSALFIDSLGRVLQTKEDAELDLGSGTSTRAGMRVSGLIGFDRKGRIASQGQPVFDDGPANQFVTVPPKNPTAFEYDVLDRVREVRFPHGAVTRVDYGFGTLDGADRLLSTRLDPNGRATRFYRDVQGDVLGVEQSNTYSGVRKTLVTRYDYDALSQLTSVTDPKGNATRLEYDTLGRNVILDNPDLGRTEFRYDPAGNLGAKITANLAAAGKQVRYLYTFNRLDRIDYPQSPDVAFTYGGPGAPENRAGRVAMVTNESGVEERFYGKLGEVVRTVKTAAALNGNTPKGPYTTRFQFDSFNRLLSVVYPDGETLTYGYDAGGQVKSASGILRGVRFDYLRHMGYDEFGARARTVHGNGVEARYAYDPQSRYLSQLRTTGAGRDLQNLRYQYDPTGTVLAIQNHVPVPPPPLYGGPASQTFRYDDLYQLIAAEGIYRGPPNKQSTYSLSLAYDETGNVTAKNQLHQIANGNGKPNVEKKTTYDWAYTYSGPQPHAPTHIGDRTFRYDLNGNQAGWDHDKNGTRRTLAWDEENRLKAVADNGQTTRFLYDSGGTRTNKAGQHGETLYINRWFSIRNGAIASKHVYADDTRLATKVSPDPNPPSEKLYFYQADHLGSSHFITDDQGAVYQHLEYFPSGETWVDERSETQRTPYLFSGKELDEETGLSYFGFRYYDARQGQWISADPILEGMLDTASLERPSLSELPFRLRGHIYSYAANSPTNLVDPTGLMFARRLTSLGGTSSRVVGTFTSRSSTVVPRATFSSLPSQPTTTNRPRASSISASSSRAFSNRNFNSASARRYSTQSGPSAIDVKTGLEKVAAIRENLMPHNLGKQRTIQKRNIAYLDYTIDDQKGKLIGISGGEAWPETVGVPKKRLFGTKVVGFDRSLDSEVKLLEHLASSLTSESKGVVRLFTERPECASCAGVIEQFKVLFPNVKLLVSSGGVK